VREEREETVMSDRRGGGDATSDVLAGWDPAGPPAPLDGGPPFPTDTVVVVAAMAVGMGLGLLVGGRHPLLRVKLGGILGIAGAIVTRRMWQLPG
jgi:hypothetical protein